MIASWGPANLQLTQVEMPIRDLSRNLESAERWDQELYLWEVSAYMAAGGLGSR